MSQVRERTLRALIDEAATAPTEESLGRLLSLFQVTGPALLAEIAKAEQELGLGPGSPETGS